jgi:hypothetical protein
LQPKLIARNIRRNLLEQKERLTQYLDVLEKEETDLVNEDPDKLISHIELENNIISELSSLKKIMTPLEVIYFNSPYKKDDLIVGLKKNINELTKQVKAKAGSNKIKLDTIIISAKDKLENLKNKRERSIYDNIDSRLVDIKG